LDQQPAGNAQPCTRNNKHSSEKIVHKQMGVQQGLTNQFLLEKEESFAFFFFFKKKEKVLMSWDGC